jgi:hypothetical protein
MIANIISYGGNTFAPDYDVGFHPGTEPKLPPVSIQSLRRILADPIIAGINRDVYRLRLIIRIVGSDRDTLRAQLFEWFDPDDEDPQTLVAQNHDGIQMSVEALCEELQVYGDQRHDEGFVVNLVVDGDTRWRKTTATTESAWNITGSGDTVVVNNSGECDAYPVLTITPTANRTAGNGFRYKRWVSVIWRAERSATRYPMLLGKIDTATLVSAGKVQSDGDDWRVYVDGEEVDRWLGEVGVAQFNQATTRTWVNMDFEPAASVDLKTAIDGVSAITEIEADGDISGFPSSGILLIDDEVFVYTQRSTKSQTFLGVTRAAKGTGAGAHTAGDTIYWLQHEVWIYYGNSTLSAPDVDDDYKPAFELDTNSGRWLWDYEEFGEDDGLRAAQWTDALDVYHWGDGSSHYAEGYGGNQGGSADPWTELGVRAYGYARARRYLYNPCGIEQVTFSNGEKRAGGLVGVTTLFDGHIEYSEDGINWTSEYTIPDPSNYGTWEAWNRTTVELSDVYYISILVGGESGSIPAYIHSVECSDISVSINSTYAPSAEVGSEQNNYTIEATIENKTTGDAITITFNTVLNDELEIDTDERTVTYLEDNSPELQAVALNSVRKHWLPLAPGSNTLEYTEEGVQGVTVDIEYEERYRS